MGRRRVTEKKMRVPMRLRMHHSLYNHPFKNMTVVADSILDSNSNQYP